MKPNVFKFLDFRDFLTNFYNYKKNVNPNYSHRFIVDKVGAGSSGWFSDIIKNRINLSSKYLPKLIKLLELKEYEAEYFEVLVHFQQAKITEEKARYLNKMLKFKEIKLDLLGKEKFDFYNEWYHTPVRELLFYLNFKDQYKELAALLQPQVSSRQVKKSVEMMRNLNLIKKNKIGNFKPTSTHIKKNSKIKSEFLANYHLKNMQLAGEAFSAFKKEERDISSLTVSLTNDAYKKAAEEIRSLRKKLLALEKFGKGGRRIFQGNFQLFPLSADIDNF